MPPGMGMPGMGQQQPVQPAQIVDKLRVVLVTDKGQLSSGDLALDPNLVFQGNWLRIKAVLSDFAMPEDLSGAKLERVVVTGNREGKIHLAQLSLIQEDKPLVAQINGPEVRTVPAGQSAQFTATPQHEGVAANYQWDFDDFDGLGMDAYGEDVSYQFPEAGYYMVTLQVMDRNGQLQSRMDTIKVKVE